MKCVIFRGNNSGALQNNINALLARLPKTAKVEKVKQTAINGDLAISVWYTE